MSAYTWVTALAQWSNTGGEGQGSGWTVVMMSALIWMSILADLHSPIRINCDWITHLDGFEKFVAQEIDRDDPLGVPDIHFGLC